MAAAAFVMVALTKLDDLSLEWAGVGFVVMTIAAAITPRTGFGPAGLHKKAGDVTGPAGQEQWRGIVDALPMPAILISGQGTILVYNSGARDLIDNLRAGIQVTGVIRHPDLLGLIERARIAAEPVEIQYSERVPIERQISARAAAISHGGTASSDRPDILLTLRDVTEQERLYKMRTDFVANASHELKTPLASLTGFIDTLRGPARDDPKAREEFLAIMARQAQRMGRLIEDLFSLSRVEMTAHLRPRDHVPVNLLLGEVIESAAALAQEHEVTLKAFPLDREHYVFGDRDELAQGLRNLVQNAIRYGREKGTVRIRLERLAPGSAGGTRKLGRIAYHVIDDGQGIAPEHLSRLVERFYRVDVERSRAKGGTGLGLAIVKHIVNRHRGDLRISSELGRGSKFSVILNEARPPSRATPKQSDHFEAAE